MLALPPAPQVQIEADKVRVAEEKAAAKLKASEDALARERAELEAARAAAAAAQREAAARLGAHAQEAAAVEALAKQVEARQAQVRRETTIVLLNAFLAFECSCGFQAWRCTSAHWPRHVLVCYLYNCKASHAAFCRDY